MNNLKRIFSLALATVMVIGMMVVGASATDYVDDEKIVNKDAVETLAALGIMNGDERGFRPEDGLTRAEAAKMLAKLHNKGRDVTYGVKDTPTFTDIKGHWAEGNIEYAYAFGIANGKGNGIFDPQGELRVVELVRMTLNMMGYDEGKTGSDWELKTTVLASDLDLFAGLDTFVPTANVTRDQAAQILNNALTAEMAGGATYTVEGTELKETGKFLLVGTAQNATSDDIADANVKAIAKAQKFDSWFEAYTVGNNITKTDNTTKAAYGTDFAIAAEKDNVKVVTTEKENLSHKYLNTNKGEGVMTSVNLVTTTGDPHKGMYEVHTAEGGQYWTENDCSDLMGQKVTVLYKGNDKDDVYGIFANTKSKVVFNGTFGDVVTANGKTTVGGYEVVNTVVKYSFNNDTALGADPTAAQSIKAIDNDGDGKVETIVATPFTLGTVSYLTDKVVTVSGAGISNAKLENVVAYEGMAKGDKVVVVSCAADGKPVITKQETVAGLVTSVKNGAATIDGVSYLQNTGVAAATLGSQVTLTLWNGYYVATGAYVAPIEQSKDLALVIKIASRNNGLDAGTPIARLLLTDGKTIDVDYKDAQGTTAAPGMLVTYTVKDNVYTLAQANNAAALGYENAVPAASYDGATQKLGTGNGAKLIADDAVVVIAYDTDAAANDSSNAFGDNGATPTATNKTIADTTKFTTMTGADLKKWNTGTWGVSAATKGFTTTVDGIEYVKVLFLAWGTEQLGSAIGDGGFGYVLAVGDRSFVQNEGFYQSYTVWNGEETIEIKENQATNSGFVANIDAGDLVTWTAIGEKNVVTGLAETALTPASVIGYSGANKVIRLVNENGVEDTTNTTWDETGATAINVLYIDNSGTTPKGVLSSGVPVVTPDVDGAYALNVKYVAAGGKITYLIVDVSGDFGEKAPVFIGAAPVGGNTVTLNLADVKALGDGIYQPATGTVKGTGFESDHFGDITKVVFINFTPSANDTYKLAFYKVSDDSKVYEETAASLTKNTKVTFRVDTVATTPGIGDATNGGNKWETNTTMPAGDYYFQITNSTGDVVMTGTFTK